MVNSEDTRIIRNKIFDRTLLASALYILIPLSTSIIRSIDIGWQPIYYLHISIASLLIMLYFFKDRLSYSIKTHSFFVLYLFLALFGVFSFRTVGAIYYIVPVVVLSTVVHNVKVGVIYGSIFILFYILVAYLHVNEMLINSIDFAKYVNAKTTWLTQFISVFYILLVTIYPIGLSANYFIDTNKALTDKSVSLKVALDEITLIKEKYYSVIESSNDGYLFVDEDLKITYVNESYSQMAGYSQDELLGKDYTMLVDANERDWNDFIVGLATKIDEHKNTLEVETIHKSGTRIPTDINIYKVEENGLSHLWSVVKDLREKKKLESQIFSTMIQAEEKERERYAKELHDGLGPLLSTSVIYANAIIEDTKNEDIKELAIRAFDLLKESITATKEISNNLSPLILRDYGVVQALKSFIEKAQISKAINFRIVENELQRLSEDLEITLYRTLVELTNNSIKYSRANNVNISFDYNPNELLVQYNDDGQGFDYDYAIKKKQGYGLLNLESRIKKVGGKYKYFTSPGEGVKVIIQLKNLCQ